MTTTALHPTPPAVAGPSIFAGTEEVAAWLDEVTPVVRSLPSPSGPAARASAGRERWLATQLDLAVDALALLECEALEAEATGSACDELLWLHTQVSALLRASHTGRLPLAA